MHMSKQMIVCINAHFLYTVHNNSEDYPLGGQIVVNSGILFFLHSLKHNGGGPESYTTVIVEITEEKLASGTSSICFTAKLLPFLSWIDQSFIERWSMITLKITVALQWSQVMWCRVILRRCALCVGLPKKYVWRYMLSFPLTTHFRDFFCCPPYKLRQPWRFCPSDFSFLALPSSAHMLPSYSRGMSLWHWHLGHLWA